MAIPNAIPQKATTNARGSKRLSLTLYQYRPLRTGLGWGPWWSVIIDGLCKMFVCVLSRYLRPVAEEIWITLSEDLSSLRIQKVLEVLVF